MDYGLQGKTALITGTASQVGMGKAICLTLAKEGCTIISTDMDLEGAQQTVEAVIAMGGKGIALKVDVTEGSEVTEMVKIVLKEFGKIDILINNAGLNAGQGVPFLESKQEMWEKDIAVNLYGTMNCAKAVIPGMVIQKYGKIINFSSIAAQQGGGSHVLDKIPELEKELWGASLWTSGCNGIDIKLANSYYKRVPNYNKMNLPTMKCLRCGYEWVPRQPTKPRKCAKCNSFLWNKPKVK